MYEAPPLFHNVLKSKPSTITPPSVPMKDRKANMERMLFVFQAKNGLPLTVTGKSMFGRYFILVYFKHSFKSLYSHFV